MAMRWTARGGWLTAALFAAVVAMAPASGAAAGMEVGHWRAGRPAPPPDEVVAGGFDPRFRPADGGRVWIDGDPDAQHWLRLRIAIPQDDGAARQVLRFDRQVIDRLAVFVPGRAEAAADRFFEPDPARAGLSGSFAFALGELPPGEHDVYVAIASRGDLWLVPELLPERAFYVGEGRLGNLLAAIYAAMFVLSLSALSLYVALRERVYLYFFAFTAAMLALTAATNGHLYALPGLGWIGWWGPYGILAIGFVTGAFAIGLTRHVLELERYSPRLPRYVDFVRYGLLGIAVLCLFNLQSLLVPAQYASGVAWIAISALAVGLSAYAWRRGHPSARAFTLIWLLVATGVALRSLLVLGLAGPGFWTLYGFQLAFAVGAFLLSVGLADRVMEFRKQHDRAHQLREITDASLQVEQRRRELVESLRESLRHAPAGDLEWMAFKKLMFALKPLVPHGSAAVVAFGYHGLDLLLTEPSDLKDHYSRLLAARGNQIKSVCRARTPLQIRFGGEADDAGAPARECMYAIVPIPMPRPGWGALLVEREPWNEFEPDELRVLAEFAQVATATADEAAAQGELKRRAELDPLTGTFNRRAGDAALADMFRRAQTDRMPLSVLFVDLDHFKQVNDRHGHAVGDECLRIVADCLRQHLHPEDVLARYGGEEFLVLLPGRQTEPARQLGERIREAVAHLGVENGNGLVKLTVSVGVASRLGSEDTPQPLLERADRALYTAKRQGRNQVQVAPNYLYGGAEPQDPLVL